MPLNANYDDLISPRERVKKHNTRRWSDSPTLLRETQCKSDGILSAGHEHTQSLHDLSSACGTGSKTPGSQINLSSAIFKSEQTSMSLSKSQDSGFNKSASCLSLNSANTKYSHVESKVKKYVQGIKEAEALRRKSMSTDCVNQLVPLSSPEKKPSVSVDIDVDQVINKMQSELRDKDMLIQALQGSYDDLLLKYAQAENKIDQLRIRSLHSSPDKRYPSRQPFLDDLDFASMLPEKQMPDNRKEFSHHPSLAPEDDFEDSISFNFSDSNLLSPSAHSVHSRLVTSQPCQQEVIISAPLGPIQKLFSTTVRLDKVLPFLGQLPPKPDASKSIHDMEASVHQLPAVTEDGFEGKPEIGAGREERYDLVKYYTTADTGMSTNFCPGTTDTGIEDCIQSLTENNTAGGNEGNTAVGRSSLEPEFKPILNIPDEDAIAKVQRWRESLPNDVPAPEREATPKTTKHRTRKPVLSKKTVAVQTSAIPTLGYPYFSTRSADISDAPESRESPEITDCDNCSELCNAFCRRSPKSRLATRQRHGQCFCKNNPSGSRTKHQCHGECRTCGSTIVAPSLVSGAGPTEKKTPFYRKPQSGTEKAEKSAIRRDQMGPRKNWRCTRPGSSGAYLTRAVLLDMLLNAQTAHSCCCCCQHKWRGRQPTPSFSGDALHHCSRSHDDNGNPLQDCLDEIQRIAWDLKENLAASHDRLVNMVRKSQ